MTMTGTAAVTAQIRTDDGWAVPHAVLTVTDFAGRQVARAVADADGEVGTDPLPAGSYTVIVTAAGYGPIARTAIVGSGPAALGVVELRRSGGTAPEPGTWTIDPTHSSVQVVARHLGLSSVRGRFTEFGGRIEVGSPIERSTVHAVIAAATIDTGNGMRDDHLRSADFLDVATHPTVEFRGSGVTPVDQDRWRLAGELTLHGHTRPVDLDLEYLGTGPDPWGGTRAAFRASTVLHRQDFAMNYNQVVQAGILAVGATLRVELDIQAVRGEVLPTG